MTSIFQRDTFKLDAERITEEKDPYFGDMTVFHRVVIASEIVQPYEDGDAYKPRDELEAYTPYVDHAWITIGEHPAEGIVSERDQVGGRTVNPEYVKDLVDPKTKRHNRAGVRADVQVFHSKVTPKHLEDMKTGKKQDVSIGFFFTKDEKPGIVGDGAFKGVEYDYVQRNIFHNHTAVGIDNGRCPMPFCGLGADEIGGRLTGAPFAGFANYATGVAEIKKKNPELTDEQVDAICSKLKSEYDDNKMERDTMGKLAQKLAQAVMDELEELKGMNDAKKEKTLWYDGISWKEEPFTLIFDNLDEEVRTFLTEKGLCPTCGDKARTEAERAMSHFDISPEDWDELDDEKKQEYIDKLPEKGSGDEGCEEGFEKNEEGECVKIKEEDSVGLDMDLTQIDTKLKELKDKRDGFREAARIIEDELYSDTPSEKKRKDILRNELNQLWDELSDISDEIYAYANAKTIKITEGALNDSDEEDVLDLEAILARNDALFSGKWQPD